MPAANQSLHYNTTQARFVVELGGGLVHITMIVYVNKLTTLVALF